MSRLRETEAEAAPPLAAFRAEIMEMDRSLKVLQRKLKSMLDSLDSPPAPVFRKASPSKLRHPVSGRLDAKKVAGDLGLSLRELALALKLPNHQAMSKTPDAKSLQERLYPFEEISRGRIWFGNNDKLFREWLNTPHEDLVEIDGRPPTPLEFIRMGHAGVIAGLVRDMLSGQPS